MDNNYKNILCTAIKLLRLKHKLSQEKFAELCNLNSDNLRNIEYCRHAPQPQTVDKICNTFNIDIIELLNLTRTDLTEYDKTLASIETLNEKQLSMLNDFISILKNY